jgi:hypothetical protein
MFVRRFPRRRPPLDFAVLGYITETSENDLRAQTADDFQRGFNDTTTWIRDLAKGMLEHALAAEKTAAQR